MQTDYTVGLPGFPTLLSAEGDFLIKAGSIHITYNTFNNTVQEKKGQEIDNWSARESKQNRI